MSLLLLAVACAHHAPPAAATADPRALSWLDGSLAAQPAPPPCGELLEPLGMLGGLIYAYDKAAWHATDAALPTLQVLQAGGVDLAQGWLVVPRDGALVVEWVRLRNGAPEVVVEVPVSLPGFVATKPVMLGNSAAFAGNPEEITLAGAVGGRALTAAEAAQLQAVQLAIGQSERPASDRVNVVTVPVGEDGREWWVYLLPATTDPDVTLVGGAVQVIVKDGAIADVSWHGRNVFRNPKKVPEGATAGAYVSLPGMRCPSETLVFSSLQYENLPIFLLGADGAWGVKGKEISYLGPVSR